MKRILPAVAVLAAATFASAAEPNWTTSWEKAAKLSKQSGLPVLVLFTGSDWCRPCMDFEKTICDTGVFGAWSKSHVVLLRLDYPRFHKQPADLAQANQLILNRYRVGAFPTVLFLTSSGQIIGNYGYSGEGPSFWTKNAEIIMKAGTDRLSGRHSR